ncbi:hypothetical protein [Larkinella arboricola]
MTFPNLERTRWQISDRLGKRNAGLWPISPVLRPNWRFHPRSVSITPVSS